MPHLSQKELDTKTKKRIIETFEMVLGSMNEKEINSFLFSILSETERLMISKRLMTALLLKEGLEQSLIAGTLGITRETVNRIELNFMKKNQGFEKAFEKIQNDKLMQEFKNKLIKLASYSIKAAGGRVSF